MRIRDLLCAPSELVLLKRTFWLCGTMQRTSPPIGASNEEPPDSLQSISQP